MGTGAHKLFPNHTAEPGAYALVGMGAVVAATTRAPITAILIIFEMTSEYSIILPLMTACIIATLFNKWMSKESIYTMKLIRRGVDIFQGKEAERTQAAQCPRRDGGGRGYLRAASWACQR